MRTREDKLAYNRKYYLKNRKRLVEDKRVYREQNRSLLRDKQRQYRLKNREKVNQRKMANYYDNHELNLTKRRLNYKKNRDKLIEKRREYVNNNRDKINSRYRESYLTSPQVRLARITRARIRDGLRFNRKSVRTEVLLGCNFKDYRAYLESLFKAGMTWMNYGEWEIDHIIPISSFDLSKKSAQLKAFHYTNTQPLWYSENRKKGNKILS